MAVTINIPSQVKTYANLAVFPASGSLKTIYIAEDTNKTYRWTGSVYVEISASAAMTWGQIGGTLSNQTDLQNALDAKVPTSRTLTINGVTQDLSADRTFTIATGLTVGTTPISSGTIGRVLFQGTGNVLQQSGNLFWDNTNARLGVGTSSPTKKIDILGSGDVLTGIKTTSSTGAASHVVLNDANAQFEFGMWGSARTGYGAITAGNAYIFGSGDFAITSNANIKFGTGATPSEKMRLFSTGNFAINTTTDAGFRLDVNGTARVQGSTTIAASSNFGLNITRSGTSGIAEQIYNSAGTTYLGADSSAGAFLFTNGLPYASFFGNGANYPTQFGTNGAIRMTIFAGGNVGINTTTDAGYKLDVNGTARVSGQFDVVSGSANFRVNNNSTYVQLGIGSTAWATYNSVETYYGGSQFYFQGGANFRFAGVGQFGFTGNPSNSAILQAESTTKGFLPPRMTTTQRDAIASPAAGLVVYQNTNNLLSLYNGTNWQNVISPNSTGNVLINTTTDAGFRLDVNGTARVSGNFNIATGFELNFNNANVGIYRNANSLRLGGYGGIEFLSSPTTIASQTVRMVLFDTGNLCIGNTLDVASARLIVNSTTQGFLPPRMTTTQKNAIASPATGLQVFDTTLNRPCFYNGTTWITL